MTYDEIVITLKTVNQVPLNSEDSNFERILPAAFLYADGRIYRELNFLATDIMQPLQLTANAREVVLPESVHAVRSLSVCIPAGPITNNSRRRPLERISPEALDIFWPQSSFKVGVPKKFAVIGGQQLAVPFAQPQPPTPVRELLSLIVRLMPTPDRSYVAEMLAGIQPVALSDSNRETFLTRRYPELFIAACNVWIAGAQRDYGSQADDPARAMSWEAQYKQLRDGIMLEVAQTRGEGPGFTSLPPAQIAQQPRSP